MSTKKTVLTLAVIAASGAYAIKEAAIRYDWMGTSSPVALAARDPLLSPSSLTQSSLPAVVATPPAATLGVPAESHRATTIAPPGAADAAIPARKVPLPAPRGATAAQPIETAPVVRPPVTPAGAPAFVPPSPTLAPPAPNPAPSPGAKAPGALFRDGSFTGSRFDAYYGMVQVRAVIKDGKLASVDVLNYPADRRTSQQINRYALPILLREVVQAQGVRVNIVSGATLTTDAYLRSLRSALALAQ